MQYEIAHCRHATEGAASRLWYTTSWLEERALLWAPEYAPLTPLPTHQPSPWQQGGGEGGREEGGMWWGTSTTQQPAARDQTKQIREPGDYSTLKDWGRLVALGSQVQVRAGWPIICSLVGHFEWGEEGRDKRLHWRRSKLSKTPFLLKTWMQPVLLSWSWISHNTDSQETGSLASKAASSQLFLVSNSWFAI